MIKLGVMACIPQRHNANQYLSNKPSKEVTKEQFFSFPVASAIANFFLNSIISIAFSISVANTRLFYAWLILVRTKAWLASNISPDLRG